MINLLPPDIKQDYHYGRRNHILLRWVSLMFLTLVGAMLLSGFGYLYLKQTASNYDKQIASTNQQLSAANFTKVQSQVKAISDNLKLADQVLSKEILFSELLKRLGSVTPSNTILTNLAILQAEGGIDITAQTTDYNAATQLQLNLADPKNQIFSKADIVNINCNGQSDTYKQYPCTVNLRALFATNNPFLFINDGKKAGS